MSRIVLLSDGLTSRTGHRLLSKIINKNEAATKRILLISLEKYRLSNSMKNVCLKLGFDEENIFVYTASTDMNLKLDFDFIYVSEGNTFELLDFLKMNGLISLIQQNFKRGDCTYIGSSAGAAIAGKDIKLISEFDKNKVGLDDLAALSLFGGTIIPHFTKVQLKRFIALTDEVDLKEYEVIYSVANNRVFVIEDL